MRLRIDCAYDGTDFHGWAKQRGQRTVQGELETAVNTVLHLDRAGQPGIGLIVAGRTDAGVHASGQVCHCDIDDDILGRAAGHLDPSLYTPWDALSYRLQGILPPDIAVRKISPAPEGFDARFSASDRVYVYRVADSASRYDPRMRKFVLPVRCRLDSEEMNKAMGYAVGLHDFGSFASPNPGGTTIREVKFAVWQRIRPAVLADSVYHGEARPGLTRAVGSEPEGKGAEGTEEAASAYAVTAVESGLLEFTVIADAFARNMVRSLVNASIQIGMGKKDTAWFRQKLAHPVREGATGPAPACGLTLERVNYPAENLLKARADAVRARRTLA